MKGVDGTRLSKSAQGGNYGGLYCMYVVMIENSSFALTLQNSFK